MQLPPHTNEDLRPIGGDWPVAPHAAFVLTFYMSALPGALLVRSPSPVQLYMSILQYADDVWDCNDWGDDVWLRQKSAAVAARGWPELDFASFVDTRDRYTKILFAALHAMAHPRVIEVPHAPTTHAGREHATRVAKGQRSPVRVLDLVQVKFTAPVEEPAAEPESRGATGLTYRPHWRRSTEAMHRSTRHSGCEHDWVLAETGRTWAWANCGGRKWHRREARIDGGGEPPITLVR